MEIFPSATLGVANDSPVAAVALYNLLPWLNNNGRS